MTRVILRLAVPADILEIVTYLASGGDAQAADRFPSAVQQTLEFLAENPGAGSPKPFRSRALAGMRSWAVAGFPNHLVYYRYRRKQAAIIVSAVLHGARDVRKTLHDRETL